MFSGLLVFRNCGWENMSPTMFAKQCFREECLRKFLLLSAWCIHLQKTWLGNNISGLPISQKQIWEIMSPLKFFLYCPGRKKRIEQIKHSYQSLHHVHSSLSHCTHLSKNIDRIDDTFLQFIKDRIYSKEDASSANTSTRK
jgi:hypothetical protein